MSTSSVIPFFDVAVVGGGHAGLEALNAAATQQIQVVLITLEGVPIVSAPCNPAVGGVGKGQVVREIDALGGLMGKLADMAGIQFRTLNAPKGYSVQSTRVQIDKYLYSQNATKIVESMDNVTIIRQAAIRISKKKDFKQDLFVIDLHNGTQIQARSVVITAGTFLDGLTHMGEVQRIGGRMNHQASVGGKTLIDIKEFCLNKSMKRFKTGTPPRLVRSSIDFSALEPQPSDEGTLNFHLLGDPYKRHIDQVSCHLTRTTKNTFDVIQKNLHRSPMFNGQISARGPRYCPSIEDKIHRYPDRFEHHLFLEPESLDLETIYPNGISTSLPIDVQQEIVSSIPGLEKATIAIPGYAVEYDVLDTTVLDATLGHKNIPGLYFAGQLNGTSGYEEAAGQGLVAGVNAARFACGLGAWILPRSESYIGVMVDDLIGQQRDEPYRLFTARCENRLALREDNALLRMASFREVLGHHMPIDTFLKQTKLDYELLCAIGMKVKMNSAGSAGLVLKDYLKMYPKNVVEVLQQVLKDHHVEANLHAIRAYAIDCVYDGPVQKGLQLQEKMLRLDGKTLNWSGLLDSSNISFECKERIKLHQPVNFRQLKNIPGIRAATLVSVMGEIT